MSYLQPVSIHYTIETIDLEAPEPPPGGSRRFKIYSDYGDDGYGTMDWWKSLDLREEVCVLYSAGYSDGTVVLVVLHQMSEEEIPQSLSDYDTGLDLVYADLTSDPVSVVIVPLVTVGEMPTPDTLLGSFEVDVEWSVRGSTAEVVLVTDYMDDLILRPRVLTRSLTPLDSIDMQIEDVAYVAECTFSYVGSKRPPKTEYQFSRHLMDAVLAASPTPLRRLDGVVRVHRYEPVAASRPSLSLPFSMWEDLQRLRREVHLWVDYSADLDADKESSLVALAEMPPKIPRVGRSPPLDRGDQRS